jgi:mRNA interferase RelE/StbE
VKISRTERFKKSWERLAKRDKALARKAIKNLTSNILYPSLRVKKIKGVEDIWEARVSKSLRVTFQMEGNLIILRNIGPHDEALNNP